jgi:nucleotide-binding universal stress UspA family protein
MHRGPRPRKWGLKAPSASAGGPSPRAISPAYARLMKHILLAIDSGAPSWEATRMAIHIAPRLRAPVTVLTTVVTKTPHRDRNDQAAREFDAARELVDDVVKQLVRARVIAKGEVRSCGPGEVAREILNAATRSGADLILMGGRARGELTGLLFGSVSHKVAIGARCPVVIVPAGAATKVTPRLIVLVIDGEGDPSRPLTATAELARSLEAAVEVVCIGHTLGDPDTPALPPSLDRHDEEAVEKAVATLKKAGVETRSRMIENRRGFAPEIAREVMAIGADMVVIGTRAIGLVGGDIGAGAAEAVIHRTHRPVVVAPSRRRP